MSIEIAKNVLEDVCKEMIETILLCIPNAFKGTIYRIGPPPELIAERITSGIINNGDRKISWGLPAKSEYNPPGKRWSEYCDLPGRPQEAMSWCIEKQKSWTVEDPKNDTRSVRRQTEGKNGDSYHMEPVLIRKSNLQLDPHMPINEWKEYQENDIWKESDYIVVGVIKIHFSPSTAIIGRDETRIIKKLSRSLGTELLSFQLRDNSVRALQRLAQDRLNSINIIADSLRNVITKCGMIFSLIKQEVGYLREQWEQLLLEDRKEKDMKEEAIRQLRTILATIGEKNTELVKNLMEVQERFLDLSLPGKKGENWVDMQIKERWKELLRKVPQSAKGEKLIWETVNKLKKSLYFGQDPHVIAGYKKIPDDIKEEWVKLIYENNESFNDSSIERLIRLLGNPAINIPSRKKSRKTLKQLMALGITMKQLERNTNFLLYQVLNGGEDRLVLKRLKTVNACS